MLWTVSAPQILWLNSEWQSTLQQESYVTTKCKLIVANIAVSNPDKDIDNVERVSVEGIRDDSAIEESHQSKCQKKFVGASISKDLCHQVEASNQIAHGFPLVLGGPS